MLSEPLICGAPPATVSTEVSAWGHSSVVHGTIMSFLEPFRGHLSPNIDKVSKKMTLRYPHEGPWVDGPSQVLDHDRAVVMMCDAYDHS